MNLYGTHRGFASKPHIVAFLYGFSVYILVMRGIKWRGENIFLYLSGC